MRLQSVLANVCTLPGEGFFSKPFLSRQGDIGTAIELLPVFVIKAAPFKSFWICSLVRIAGNQGSMVQIPRIEEGL